MPLPPVKEWSFVQWIIAIIIMAACVAILYVALNVFGITIPPWAILMFWICVVAFVAIIAIKFLASLF